MVIGYQEVVVGEGIDDKRLLVIEAEFSSTLRVMERDGNTLSPIIRCAWDTGNLQTLTKNSPAKATGAHISIIGHITQQELIRLLNATEAGNGFGNRFLWLCVRRSKALPFGGDFDEEKIKPVIERLKAALEFGQKAEEIIWAEETRPLWEAVYPSLSSGKPGLIGALTARAEAYATRLACVYALLDRSTEIKPDHLKAALAIWDYCEASVRYIFQDSTGDPLANEILEALINHPDGMTRTDIYLYFQKNKSSERIQKALDVLESLGKARKEDVPTEGRSREVWFASFSS